MGRQVPYDRAGYLTKEEQKTIRLMLDTEYRMLTRAKTRREKKRIQTRITNMERELRNDYEVRRAGENG